MRRRIPLTLALFLIAVAFSGAFEWFYYRQRLPYFLICFGAEVAVCGTLVALRGVLRRRHALTAAVTLAAAALGLFMIAYVSIAGADSQLLGTALVCLLAGMSLLVPWSVRGQIVVTLAVLVGFSIHLIVVPPSAVPPLYEFFAVFTGGFISVLGAHYLDTHRFAIFHQGMLKDEAAHETRSLLHIASELNASLEARTVLERIARSARNALSCDWSAILLWDERREVFRLAAGNGERQDLLDEIRGMEFGADDFPVVKRLLLHEDLIEVSDPHPPDDSTAALVRHFETRSLLATTMVRGGRVVGLMAAGRARDSAPFLARQRRLTRGIAQQAAIALENARLVTDLRHADRLKSEFVATISHELRTPLNIILGYNDLLLEGAFGSLTAEQRDVIERVRHNSNDLLTLINATLDVNRLEAGRLPIDLEDFRMADLISDIRTEVERLPPRDNVTLEWSIDGDATVRSDPKKIKIILRNLITNALKFTDHGRVTIAAKYSPGGPLQLSVADTGIGIPPEELPNIFGMFRQVKTSARKSGGVGLGLYIVQRFVNQLQGEIEVRSSLGVGTTFEVRIPHLGADRRAA